MINHNEYINYPLLVEKSMRGMVREILKIVSKKGIIGEHHFLISFLTGNSAVKISDRLRKKYPKEMTIVLQYMFTNLVVEEDFFSVSLSFDSINENIVIPFNCLTSFVDPSTKFALQFEINPSDVNESKEEKKSDNIEHKDEIESKNNNNVIMLDKFRNK